MDTKIKSGGHSRAIVPKAIAKIRTLTRSLSKSRVLFQSVDPAPEIRHLPFSITRSLADLVANKEMNKRIREGYYKDILVIIAALPKSASSVIGSCVAEMLSISDKVTRSYAAYMRANHDSDLRPELVKDFPKGGVLKYHTRATGKNLKVLELLGVKYIIIFRHPVDQVVASYCDVIDSSALGADSESDGWVKHHIYPLPARIFRDGVDIDEGLRYMIREGYLVTVLSWMVDWLRFRNPKRSMVVKYEDFVTQKERTLGGLSDFMTGASLSAECAKRCHAIADGYAKDRASEGNVKKYPRGWTGRIGIWKDYLSGENRRAYLSVVKAFLGLYPEASCLLERYPNLLDVDSL